MRLIRRALAKGRIGRKRSFAVALVVAAMVLPVTTALAFFAATGTGTIPNIQAGAPAGVVTLSLQSGLVYAGPSTTTLQPGGTVSFTVGAACTAGCPAYVSTINLGTWTSDKAGCDMATFPGSFTMPTLNANLPSVPASPITSAGTVVITWVSLPLNQNICSGAKFAYNLVTP